MLPLEVMAAVRLCPISYEGPFTRTILRVSLPQFASFDGSEQVEKLQMFKNGLLSSKHF